MAINPELFIHDSDRAALKALQSIPGFTPLFKAFMKIWDEKIFSIMNMSTNLRVSKDQLSKYYDMLPPICEKLGIAIPELYIELDVRPNAYTSGDTKPFIVMTSGLLETLPEELIPSVLAHECGHIACHHCLYTTMGRMILDGATAALGLGDFLTMPIQIAFYYWMRCSEFSADRAAALCDGNANKVIEMCMRFAGFDKDISGDFNVDAFMNQAIDYKKMVDDSKWNKTLEFLIMSREDHPLNAVRAYECREWCTSDNFKNLTSYLQSSADMVSKIPVTFKEKQYLGQNYLKTMQDLQKIGFVDIKLKRLTEQKGSKAGNVVDLKIDGRDDFKMGDWFAYDVPILITYFEPLSEEEIEDMHQGEIRIPDASKSYIGRNYRAVVAEMKGLGFINVEVIEKGDLKKGWLNKEGRVAQISIGSQAQFGADSWFLPDTPVLITYHTYTE